MHFQKIALSLHQMESNIMPHFNFQTERRLPVTTGDNKQIHIFCEPQVKKMKQEQLK